VSGIDATANLAPVVEEIEEEVAKITGQG